MNDRITLYLNAVCSHIKCRPLHQEIREELCGHIEELTQMYIEQGNSEAEALERAIADMGDSDETGRRLNQQHKPQTDSVLIGLAAVITIIGVVQVYIGSEYAAASFIRQLTYVLMGAAVFTGLYFLDFNKLMKLDRLLYIAAVLMLIGSRLIGVRYNGISYLPLGPVSISSQYITPLLLIAFASLTARGSGGKSRIELAALAAVTAILSIITAGYAQAVILITGYLLITIVLNGKRKNGLRTGAAMLTALAGAAGFAYLSRGAAEEISRDAWLSSAKWIGSADTPLIDKTSGILTTDYILVNVITSLGLLAGVLFVLIAAVFIIRLIRTTRKIKSSYGYSLSLTAALILTIQFTASILINLDLLPGIGVSVPFVSYSGSGYLINMILLGIILSVWRTNNMQPTQICE